MILLFAASPLSETGEMYDSYILTFPLERRTRLLYHGLKKEEVIRRKQGFLFSIRVLYVLQYLFFSRLSARTQNDAKIP